MLQGMCKVLKIVEDKQRLLRHSLRYFLKFISLLYRLVRGEMVDSLWPRCYLFFMSIFDVMVVRFALNLRCHLICHQTNRLRPKYLGLELKTTSYF